MVGISLPDYNASFWREKSAKSLDSRPASYYCKHVLYGPNNIPTGIPVMVLSSQEEILGTCEGPIQLWQV